MDNTSSMEILSAKYKMPWSSMEFGGTREHRKSSMEFHGNVSGKYQIQLNVME